MLCDIIRLLLFSDERLWCDAPVYKYLHLDKPAVSLADAGPLGIQFCGTASILSEE